MGAFLIRVDVTVQMGALKLPLWACFNIVSPAVTQFNEERALTVQNIDNHRVEKKRPSY